MELLVLLCKSSGSTFTYEQIKDHLWPDITINQDAIANTMTRLRKALVDDSKAPIYIETIQKKGYRLLIEPQYKKIQQPNKKFQLSFALLSIVLVVSIVYWLNTTTKPNQIIENMSISKKDDGYDVDVTIDGDKLKDISKDEAVENVVKSVGQLLGDENAGYVVYMTEEDDCKATKNERDSVTVNDNQSKKIVCVSNIVKGKDETN